MLHPNNVCNSAATAEAIYVLPQKHSSLGAAVWGVPYDKALRTSMACILRCTSKLFTIQQAFDVADLHVDQAQDLNANMCIHLKHLIELAHLEQHG